MLYTAAAPAKIQRVQDDDEHGDVGVYVVNAPKQSTKLCFLMYWRSYIHGCQVMEKLTFFLSIVETFSC